MPSPLEASSPALPGGPPRRHGRVVVRRAVGAVVTASGLVHLLGAAAGLGWASVPALGPVGPTAGVAWLVVGLLVVAAGIMLARSAPRWWVVCAVAAVASQGVILTSWAEARAGTAVVVLMLVAALYGWASRGPRSLGAEYDRRASLALAAPVPTPTRHSELVTEQDLCALPPLVAGYVRRSGAVGQPRVTGFRARLHGRIRGAATSPWMPFTAEQVSTYGPQSCRLFTMDASFHHVPVDVLHVYLGERATMRVRAASLVTMVDASGPEMDRAETVTIFNDLCVFAPAALVDADVQWQQLGVDRVHATFTRGAQTVEVELRFVDDELVDFVSDDRMVASADGRTFSPRRWSTPLATYRTVGSRRVATQGDARWGGTDADEAFTYLELTVDDIDYDVQTRATSDVSPLHAPSTGAL